jgi:hypothetical protein
VSPDAHAHIESWRQLANGQAQRALFVVRGQYLKREIDLTREMGYTLTIRECTAAACLGPEPAHTLGLDG